MTATMQPLPFDDPKTRALAELMKVHAEFPIRTILVVGCGKGIEAAVLGHSLQAQVVGIDIESAFDNLAAKYADLRLGDALKMNFSDGQFDAVYSFHALEHMTDHRQALAEIRRVLRKGGVWLVGTPNRDRLIGYVGSKGASFADKLRWNIADWKFRLAGKFENEHGAHAGFSANELYADLYGVFGAADNISLAYYLKVYSSKGAMIRTLAKLGMSRWL